MENYADLMFTPSVRSEQEKNGSAATYARSYQSRTKPGLGADEIGFLQARNSIYMASLSETGWPYIQHRGGPTGFLKVLDDHTIGFADYRGNRQYISKGNLNGNDRVSLFAMDYANKARLKLQGHARMIEAGDDPDLASRLTTDGQGRVERLTTIRIIAFDWNCSQYITPRHTQDDVTALVAPHLASRDQRIAALSAKLEDLGIDPTEVP